MLYPDNVYIIERIPLNQVNSEAKKSLKKI